MIEPRIYRAAFLPALFALVLVAFSLESPPRALDQGLAADALFEGTSAVRTVQMIAATAPDRSPGSPGDQATGRRVAAAFRAHGFTTTLDRFDDQGKSLMNVIGRRAGDSTREIVIMAARDSNTKPDLSGSAADTAALMEFANVFEGRALNRTLVLASVDGSTLGDSGARRFAEKFGDPSQIEAVIVVSNLAAKRSRGPLVIGWSNDATRTGLGLTRTVTGSLREELGQVPKQEAMPAQFARLAFPVAPGAQAPLLDAGLDAVRISGSGELRPADTGGDAVGVIRYGQMGRSVLRMIATLDGDKREPARGETSYLTIAGNLLPAWSLRLLAISLMLPALIASVDALARARRRHERVAEWFVWLGANVLPFVLALIMGWLLVLVGLIDDAPPAALDPRSATLDAVAICALVATSFTALLAWLLARTRVIRRAGPLPDPAAPGAACAVSLTLSALGLAVAFVNPFAGLTLVLAVHLWMLVTLSDIRPRNSIVLAAIGLAPIALVAIYYMWRFELGPLRAAWYLLLLVTGNQPGLLTTGVLCLLLGITASVAAILVARVRHGEPRRRRTGRPPEPAQSIFGPGGHAGPGMLGGSESTTIRR